MFCPETSLSRFDRALKHLYSANLTQKKQHELCHKFFSTKTIDRPISILSWPGLKTFWTLSIQMWFLFHNSSIWTVGWLLGILSVRPEAVSDGGHKGEIFVAPFRKYRMTSLNGTPLLPVTRQTGTKRRLLFGGFTVDRNKTESLPFFQLRNRFCIFNHCFCRRKVIKSFYNKLAK